MLTVLARVFIVLALFRVGPGRCWRQTSVNINWVSKQGWITFGAAEIISLYHWTSLVLLNVDTLMTTFSDVESVRELLSLSILSLIVL